MPEFEVKDRYGLSDSVDIIAYLRSKRSCH